MTHNEKVLALLSDGKPHTHHEIYGLYVIGHSRIADLRKRGHVIESWRDGDDYLYQLCAGEPSAPSPRLTADSSEESEARLGTPSLASPAQLTLEAA